MLSLVKFNFVTYFEQKINLLGDWTLFKSSSSLLCLIYVVCLELVIILPDSKSKFPTSSSYVSVSPYESYLLIQVNNNNHQVVLWITSSHQLQVLFGYQEILKWLRNNVQILIGIDYICPFISFSPVLKMQIYSRLTLLERNSHVELFLTFF